MHSPAVEPPVDPVFAPPIGPPVSDAPPPAPPKPRRRIGWIITVIVLVLALIAAGVVIWLALQRLDEARDTIEEQQELIDKKETFSSAMQELVATVQQFDGVLFGSLVPMSSYNSLAGRGWDHRWNPEAMDRDTADVRKATEELAAVLTTAQAEVSGNATGSAYETTIDALGSGYVRSVIDELDESCGTDAAGCVFGEDPYLVHFDIGDVEAPYMNDWLRTGVAYHEFAHVLQMTNPEPTEVAAAAFGGDIETMADCYALTYLDGWTLDHEIWVSDFEYWEVSLGYGYTCDESQRQVVRDWYTGLGFHPEPISQ